MNPQIQTIGPEMFGKRRFLIDARGQSCVPFAERRRRVVTDKPFNRESFFEIAVHEEGWVDVEVDPQSRSAHLRLDVSRIAPNALVGAGNLLITQPVADVRLRCFADRWTEYHFDGGAEAASGLLQAVFAGMDAVGRKRFRTTEVDLANLSDEERDICANLFLLFDYWRERAFSFDPSVFDFLKTHGLYERSTLVEPSSDTLGGVFVFTGPGFDLYGKHWPRQAMGMPITDQPDQVYGRWVGHTYERLFKLQSPEIVRVDATIMSYPAHAPRRSYICARLPWRADGGQELILSASFLLH